MKSMALIMHVEFMMSKKKLKAKCTRQDAPMHYGVCFGHMPPATLTFILQNCAVIYVHPLVNDILYYYIFLFFIVRWCTYFMQNCPPYVLPLPCNVSLNATSLWHHCLLVVNMVFTEDDKVAMKFLRENKHYRAKNFPQSNGRWVDWTKFWRKSTRQVLLNERNVPVDRGRWTTTSNALSSWHLVCARVTAKGGRFEHRLSQ